MNIEYPWTSNLDRSIDNYKSIIDYYIDSVGNPILDTAYYYANTKTEHILGQIIPELSKKPIIATKANPWYQNDFTNGKFGQLSKDNLIRQFEESKKNLVLDQIDIFYLHCWDWETPIIETLDTCTELWRKEKFNEFGISNFSLNQITQVLELIESNGYCPVKYYQGMYNLLARKIEETFDILYTNKIEFWAYNPLAGGLLTGKYKDQINDINLNLELESRFKSNPIYQNIFWKKPILNGIKKFVNIVDPIPTSYSLNWYNSKYNHSTPKSFGLILGASTLNQIKENINLINLNLNLSKQVYLDLDFEYKNFSNESPNYYY